MLSWPLWPFSYLPTRTRDTILDSCDIFTFVCLYIDDWFVDNTMDDDCWVVPQRDPRDRPLHFLLTLEHLYVCSCPNISVTDRGNFLKVTSNTSLSSPFQAFLGSPYALQWFFAAVSVLAFFYALLVVPETHGKKLQEIEAYFTKPSKTTKRETTSDPKVPKETNTLIMQPRLKTISETEVMLKDDNKDKILS